MTPADAGGPGVAHPEPAEKITTTARKQDHGQRSRPDALPVVRAVLLLAVAGALFDRLLVRTCCWCHCAHLHYLPVGGETTGIVRSPRCAPRRPYVVEVTDRLPVALVAGQRRRAGAA